MSRLKRVGLSVASILIHIIVAVLITLIIVISNNWFGYHDIPAFIYWTVPIALSIGVWGKFISDAIPVYNPVWRKVIMFVATPFVAYAWLNVVYFFMGPYISTFSFPIFYLWIAGILGQLIFIDWSHDTEKRPKTGYGILKIIGFCIAACLSGFGMVFILHIIGTI